MKKLFAGLIAVAFVVGVVFLLSPKQAYDEQGKKTLENAVVRAAVHCYAVEGAYPPSIEYLEDTYGLIIDHERFLVDYVIFASNVMPDVTVYSRNQGVN